jgi:hypothetical protein
MRLLAAFPALSVRAGWVLRAYQFRASGNGNGVVWAMPEDAPFPEPSECPQTVSEPVPGVALRPPRPARALDDVMEVIEGESRPWTYLSASIFAREASELGALWHGSSWGVERVLDADPWLAPPQDLEVEFARDSTPDAWSWNGWARNEAVNRDWRPAVDDSGDAGVTVSLLAYSGHIPEEIVRHVDRFDTPGSYRLHSEREQVAEGPGGFIF